MAHFFLKKRYVYNPSHFPGVVVNFYGIHFDLLFVCLKWKEVIFDFKNVIIANLCN